MRRHEGRRLPARKLHQHALHLLAQTPPGDNCFILEDNTVQPFVTIGNIALWTASATTPVIETTASSRRRNLGYMQVGTQSFLGVNSRSAIQIALGSRRSWAPARSSMKNTAPKSVYLSAPSCLKTSDEIEL